MNIPPQNQKVPFDKEQLLKYIFNLLISGNPSIIQEANTQLMEMENNQEFLTSLIEIFETENNVNVKNQIFLVFKSAFKRFIMLNQDPLNKLKNDIKIKLVNYIQIFKDLPSISKHIQSSILDIVELDFPINYKPLLEYIRNGYETILGHVNQNPMILLQIESLRFFTEIKTIFKRKRQGKNFPKINELQFREFFETILQSCFSIISLVNNNFSNFISNENKETAKSMLILSLLNDEIILMILQYLNPDSSLEEIFQAIIEQMFQKCSLIVQTLLKDPKNIPLEFKSLLNKNFKGILYNFSILQYNLPFMFVSYLSRYCELIKFIIDNNFVFQEKVLKSGLVCLYKILKSFGYFADPQTYTKSLGKNDKLISDKIQRQANSVKILNALFTEQTLEEFLFSFLQNILIREFNKQKDEENYENLIEIDNDDGLEDTTNEFENSVYNLTLSTVELLFQRFPTICFAKLNNLTNQLVSINNSDDIEKPIQDGIFALLGVLPKVFVKLKVVRNPLEFIDILKVLEFLKNNLNKDVLYARRFASLTLKWMNVLNDQVLKNISDLIYQILLNFNHHLIQYESIKCLNELIKTKNVPVNYQDILLNIVPIIINIIEKFKNPIIICPLIEFLNILLEKTQYNCPQILASAIQNPSFKKLIQNDSDLLRNAICEMFKSLIVSFTWSSNINITEIIIVALDFIDQSFQINIHTIAKDKYEGGVLRLWLLIVKEYDASGNDKTGLIAIKQIYTKYSKKLLNWRQEADMDIIVEILEENILMDFNDLNNNYLWVIKFIEDKYDFSNILTHPDSIIVLKISILSLLATLILKLYNQKQELDFKIFEKIIYLILNDLMRPKWLENSKKFHGFRTSLLTLINRFLIKNSLNMVEIFQKFGKLEEFVESWIYSMNEITSGNACKINIIAVCNMINVLESSKTFFVQFETFIDNLLSNFNYCLKYDGQNEILLHKKMNNINLSETHNGISKRKEMIRKTNLFDEFEIKSLFTKMMQELLLKKNYKEHIHNPNILQKLSFLC